MSINYEFKHTNGPSRVIPEDIFLSRPVKFFNSDNFGPTGGMRRFLGVEIEVSGLKPKLWLPNALSRYVETRSDGFRIYEAESDKVPQLLQTLVEWNCSVVRDAGGFEIQTSPAQGANFTKQISALCTALADSKALISNHCGLHVHADMRDVDLDGLRKLVVFYAKFEKTLLKTQSPQRIFMGPCFPVGASFALGYSSDTVGQRLTTVEGIPVKTSRELLSNKIRQGKYLSMNLAAYLEHRTIEIRMHEGTINPNEIIPWAVGVGAIVDATQRMSLQEIEQLKPGMTALRDLMPKESYDYLVERRKMYSELWTDSWKERLVEYDSASRWTY